MEHILKVPKKKFEPLLNGDLTFVIRRADRLYSVGDRLVLFEMDGAKETGRSLVVHIKFIAHSEDTEGIKDDYCVFSVKRSAKNSRTRAERTTSSANANARGLQKIGLHVHGPPDASAIRTTSAQ